MVKPLRKTLPRNRTLGPTNRRIDHQKTQAGMLFKGSVPAEFPARAEELFTVLHTRLASCSHSFRLIQ